MPNITLRVENIDTALQGINEYSLEIQKSVKKHILLVSLLIESAAKRKVRVDTGKLRASIKTIIYLGGLSVEIGSYLPYATYVEYGTLPHQSSRDHDVFVRAIQRYSKHIGAVDSWYPILRRIQQQGTQPKPFLQPAFELYKDNLSEAIKNEMNKEKKI